MRNIFFICIMEVCSGEAERNIKIACIGILFLWRTRKGVGVVQIIDKLNFYMQYPFVRYALVVGVLIALCSSLFGATLVLKRFSFIGDGLSHVAFGAMAIGSVLKLTITRS